MRVKHGHLRRIPGTNVTVRSPTYQSWRSMKERCNRPRHPYYDDYGGRGITVCERWASFEAFLEDMGERPGKYHTLERKRVNEGYCKDNCEWRTVKEQANNRRSNRMCTVRGESMTLSQAVDALGIRPDYAAIVSRCGRGWDVDTAINTPVRKRKKAA